MATVTLTPIKGEQKPKTFELGHAQRIFDLQAKCPPASWKLTDPGYNLVGGIITAVPAPAPAPAPAPTEAPAAASATPAAASTPTPTPTSNVNTTANGPADANANTGTDKAAQKQG